MRQRLITFLFAFFAVNAMMNAETVQLSFSGVTTEGRYCLLDSVKIENLTQNWSQTLDCCIDTTYELPVAQVPTGIDNIAASDNEDELLSVSQNFAIGNTLFTINPLNNGVVRMRVMDMIGRVIIEHAEYLSAGYHQYSLQLGIPQAYMLSVITDAEHASAKILNMTSSGKYDLSRVTSFPTAYQSPSRRKVRAEGEDLMQYTGYTNQKGVAVSSEQITQYQSSPEHIVLRFAPVAKSQEGMYVGMMGFNNALYPYSFDILTSSNLYAHQNFVSNLTMANGTILYHAVYTSLSNIINAPVPEKLENVSIVTFTDGLDIGSWRMNSNYPSEALYLAAVNKQIHRTYIDGIILDAYAIGVKGSDVTDVARFESDLHQLASDSANVYSVSNMSEVNARFREIAAKIYNAKVNYSMTIKLPAPDPGSLIRFTFDDVTDANNSIYYIEGTYDYDFSANMGILKNVVYSGIQCGDGTMLTSVPDGIFDVFTIRNIATNLGERLSTTSMSQWSYIPSTNKWQINSEFDPSSNSSSTEERTSALVMLVLDCSSSLSSDFSQMQSAANNFLSILTGKGSISKPSVSKATYQLGDLCATLSASISSSGNLSITDKGFCISEYQNMDNTVFYSCGAGTDGFEYLLTGLIDGKIYYVRPYAENHLGRTYGYQSSFTAIAFTAPTLTTSDITSITNNTATCGGTISFDGYAAITERGICWSTSPNPTINDNILTLGAGTGTFSGIMENLQDGTSYHVRAYAINSKGVGYGEEKSFTTVAIVSPSVTTSDITNITINSAKCGGDVTKDGNSDIIERGICWSKNPNPTIEDSITLVGSGVGSFTTTITELEAGATYYVRAYAKNSKEVGYGEEKSFTTVAIVSPSVTTSDVTNITINSAKCGGNVTFDGNSEVTERGICWSKKPNPTIQDSVTIVGSGLGSFTTTISDLEEGITYYVRAYAKNSKEIGYGDEKSFTTLIIVPPTITTSDVTNITTNSVTCGGNITHNGNSDIIERGLCWSTLPNPTIEDATLVLGSGSGSFSGTIENWEDGTTYYVRAYAKNVKKIGYGNDIICTTIKILSPKVSLSSVSVSETGNVTCSGKITSNGNSPIVKCGFCLSTNPNPTIDDTVILASESSFNKTISSLKINKDYYVRAFAMNSKIVGYSAELSSPNITFYNMIKYNASSKLAEVTKSYEDGLHTNVFNTSIKSHSFSNGKGLIVFSDNLIYILDNAFSGCSKVTSIEIPNSVTTIGNNAFQSCRGLTAIDIPNSVTSIGAGAFSGCTGLVSINIEETNLNYSSIDGVLFNKNKTSIIQYPIGKQNQEYAIPNSVTSIGGFAFSNCTSLTSVTIPNSVTDFGINAFSDCTGLTSVIINDGVTIIGHYAFYNCINLTSIEIPNSVTSIGEEAIYGCTGLTSVTIGNGVTSIGVSAFHGCTGLTSVTIGNSVITIGGRAFYGCTGLTSIDIPNSVTSIGGSAFSGCTGLTSVTIPSSVTNIGESAFRNCTRLTSIDIPNSVTSIGVSAFYGCTGLTSISIPDGVTSIGDYAFTDCTGLTSITCKATTPPTIAKAFYKLSTSIPVYVPAASVSAYKSATGWKDFTNIQAIK